MERAVEEVKNDRLKMTEKGVRETEFVVLYEEMTMWRERLRKPGHIDRARMAEVSE